MGIFKRRLTPNEPPQPLARPLGSGRRLHSDLALTDCLATLDTVIRSYTQLKSAHRTAYVVPGWRWNGAAGSVPNTVISFGDTDGFPLFVAFWPTQGGTECALFPLGGGDERLTAMPIIGYWKQQDNSLTSIGLVPQGHLSVAAPQLPDEYFKEILEASGFPSSPRNVLAVGLEIAQMFGIKAWEFINSKDPRGAERFIDDHAYRGGPVQGHCQRILDDLAAWSNGTVLPYIQDMPMRCKAILLEVEDDENSFWKELER